MKKLFKNKHRILFICIAVFVILLTLFFGVESTAIETKKTLETKSALDFTKSVAIQCYETLDSLGNGAISIYLLHGQIAYFSIIQIDDMGYGVIAAYELTGKSAYVGAKEAIKTYKEVFTFSSLNPDKKISSYSANVSGGVEIVKDFLKKKLKNQ